MSLKSNYKKFAGYAKRLKSKGPGYFARVKYLKYYTKYDIRDNVILISSKHGDTLASNLFYLAKELCENEKYSNYKIYIEYTEKGEESIKALLKNYNMDKRVILVPYGTKQYYKVCAFAKYLINDTSFYPFFIKKEGQVYLNTWHGTPWKYMGRKSESDYASLGNIQRNMLMADYLLVPNEHTKEIFANDYMLKNLARETMFLKTGYPRNSIFLTDESEPRIREALKQDGIIKGDEHLYMYMPTWRDYQYRPGWKADNAEQAAKLANGVWLKEFLTELDAKLTDSEVFFVKLHPLDRESVDITELKHVKDMPVKFECYDFLNACEKLVTDYSSVFFDYEVSGKKIVLYTPDKDVYFQNRGVYFDISKLPFPQAPTTDALVKELRTPKNYKDKKHLAKYNPWDNLKAPEQVLDVLLTGTTEGITLEPALDTQGMKGKQDVLVYSGGMARNGITTSMLNFTKHLDPDKYNITVAFEEGAVKKHPAVVRELQDHINYIPLMGKTNMSMWQKITILLYRHNVVPFRYVEKQMDFVYGIEKDRVYPTLKFDYIINYSGYGYKMMHFIGRIPGPKKIVFVHNDMWRETVEKHNQHKRTLQYTYSTYDKVALVSEQLREPTSKFTKGKDDNFVVVQNMIDYKRILERGEQPLEFDQGTVCHLNKSELEDFIKEHDKVFLNVGRFSPEKGQMRLIEAFEKLKEETGHNIGLIILGGYGPEYDNIAYASDSSRYYKDIVVIQSLSNPHPLYRMCDCFVLSSLYEGAPMVFAEADLNGLPIIATEIYNGKSILENTPALLVEDSMEGVYEGMKTFLTKGIGRLNLDCEAYNEECLNEIKSIFGNRG